ncbi:MAG: glutamate-cysteine ligase family protein [Planctomycetota bacterium]
MTERAPLHIFGGFGVEMEYMIVASDTLDVLPVADKVLEAQAGELTDEVDVGPLAWSNELVLHVIEMKTNGPTPVLPGVAAQFQQQVQQINAHLKPLGGQLMPGAMHPWMDPHTQTKLWPHGQNEIYAAYDRIFSCKGHGWSNLQSTHINLPFADDDEFGKLHAAIRLILPLLPAIAAASPVKDGMVTGLMDTRLDVYRTNQAKLPSISGQVVPEPLWTRAAYEGQLLQKIYDDIRPHDVDNILQFEWLNSRGAIARFDRHAIEIRTIDIQEHPAADIAIVTATVAVLKALVAGRWAPLAAQQALGTGELSTHWREAIRDGERAVIADADYLGCIGMPRGRHTLQEIWQHLLAEVWPTDADAAVTAAKDVILQDGPLSRRITAALGSSTPSREQLVAVWRQLCTCLATGESFVSL